jgi:hypothetical protein
VLEHREAGQGDQDENEDGVEDAPQAPHQHQRILLLAENIIRGILINKKLLLEINVVKMHFGHKDILRKHCS